MPGPDAWSSAAFQLETISRSARAAGDWELAAFTARNLIEHNPNYAGGYYAMALVAQHEGDSERATQLFASARKFWSKADADLPELATIPRKGSH
jgi:tetratricopeptide (TPR) repeat protein